ncbi:MAG: hypothetical protein NXI09_06660 [Bacteroidetes bacterium]|nr:hypothetical protein [Bacteroidota bacterium]
MHIKKGGILILFMFVFLTSNGQNTVNYNLNAMVVQGEASGGGILSDDIGLGLGLGYDFPFGNPRYEFGIKFDYVWLKADYINDVDPTNISVMRGTFHHTSATGGLNIYLGNHHKMANLYRPLRPYIFVLAGLAYQINTLEMSPNFNFPNVEGALILPIAELGGGAKVRINPFWSFNITLGFRSTFSDDVDGLIGNSASPDIMGIVRIGVSKRL